MKKGKKVFLLAVMAAVVFVSCPDAAPIITIETQPAAETNVTAGVISGSLTVIASVTAEATLSYQWFSNTTASNVGGVAISGETNSSFEIPANLAAGTYFYFVEVRATGEAAPVRSAVAAVTVSLLEMVWIPGGVFELGRETGTEGFGNTTPVSTVTLSGFHIGRYPVTQEQFYEVMGFNPSHFTTAQGRPPAAGERDARRPAERVNWYEAIVFANRLSVMSGLTPAYEMQAAVGGEWTADPDLWGAIPAASTARWNNVRIVAGSTGYRLPTEAQWEFAAKGGARPGGNFTFAGSNTADDVTWHSGNSGSKTREVGLLQGNCLGLYDMSGNVWEWVWDWWGVYTGEPKTDPVGPDTGSLRVGRGGSWIFAASDSRSVSRSGTFPNIRYVNVGFRLVRPCGR